ncbi:hypothetical protein B5X24_HaOG212325 [Helicoverpa armigera]|nr:hypothetical protein B5X24_HaOG212325 [Helicoverpa armigera]
MGWGRLRRPLYPAPWAVAQPRPTLKSLLIATSDMEARAQRARIFLGMQRMNPSKLIGDDQSEGGFSEILLLIYSSIFSKNIFIT